MLLSVPQPAAVNNPALRNNRGLDRDKDGIACEQVLIVTAPGDADQSDPGAANPAHFFGGGATEAGD